jgi:hypothetical protein
VNIGDSLLLSSQYTTTAAAILNANLFLLPNQHITLSYCKIQKSQIPEGSNGGCSCPCCKKQVKGVQRQVEDAKYEMSGIEATWRHYLKIISLTLR